MTVFDNILIGNNAGRSIEGKGNVVIGNTNGDSSTNNTIIFATSGDGNEDSGKVRLTVDEDGVFRFHPYKEGILICDKNGNVISKYQSAIDNSDENLSSSLFAGSELCNPSGIANAINELGEKVNKILEVMRNNNQIKR